MAPTPKILGTYKCYDALKVNTRHKLKKCPSIPTAPKQATNVAISLTNLTEIRKLSLNT